MKKEQNYYWRIINFSDARKLLKEKKEIYQLFEDESYCEITTDGDLNDVLESGTEIGIKCLI